MAKKTISGPVIQVNSNLQNCSIVIETSPGKPAEDKKPAIQAKRFSLATNDLNLLKGIETGDTIKITIE